MLRIAQCTDSFLPVADGVGRVTFEYANALGARGHQCYVVTPLKYYGYRGGYPFEIADYVGVSVPGSPQYRTGIAYMDKHYTSRMERVELDIVHSHSPGPAGLEAVRLADRLHVPLIGTFHSKFYDDFLRVTHNASLAQLGVRYVADYFERCDEVWAVSRQAADTLRSYGYRGDVVVMENGTRIQAVNPLAASRARTHFQLTDAPILFYCGQIDWKKNLRCTVEAAALLFRRGVSFQLVMAGQGQDLKAVKALAEEFGILPVTHFVGHVSDPMLLNGLYAAAALFVFPSSYDTAGLVVREAAVMGTPSIVLRGSAPAECIQHGVNGLLCENSAESLANEIAQYLANAPLVQSMGSTARDTIPIPWDKVIDRVEERYTALAEQDSVRVKRKRGPFRKELAAIDQTLEKRTLDLAVHMFRHDLQNVYAYPRKAVKGGKRQAAKPPLSRLPRSTPEAQGVSSSSILALFDAINSDTAASAHSMLVMRHGHVIAEASWVPYDITIPHELYSLSKSVTATAIGMLVDEGKLALEEKLVDIFRDRIETHKDHPLADVTVRHLLTMSSGSRFNEIGSALGPDWETEFMSASVKFPAGSAFEYNSMNTYMLAAIVCRRSGQTLVEYLTPRLFLPLGITNTNWELCPKGIEKGGWGLSLTLEDVAKIGQLYLNRGLWTVDGQEKRLLSAQWVDAATGVQIETPNGECRYGYGYQIWMTPYPGGYLFNGAFGQYMIALPALDVVVVLFSGTSRLFAQGGVMSYVNSAFINASDKPLPEDPAALEALSATLSALTCRQRDSEYSDHMLPTPFSRLCSRVDGQTYRFPENIAGLYPMILQTTHNNYTTGIETVKFHLRKDGALSVTFEECKEKNTITVRPNCYTPGTANIRGEAHLISSCAEYGMLSTGEWLLRLYVHFVETPNTRIITFLIKGNGITMECDERPALKDAAAMLLELAGISRIELFRTLLPMLKRERLQNRLRTFTTVSVKGERA